MINFISEQLQQFAEKQGEKPNCNLVIPLPMFNLLAFLKGQAGADTPIYPAIYWQDKEQQQSIACLGLIEECHHIPQSTEQACYFGGLAFQQQGAQWQDFPAIYFIRPALEFNLGKKELTLTCHFNGQHPISDTLALVKRLQKAQPLSTANNKVLSRTDSPNQQQWADLIEQTIEYKALIPKVVLSRETELVCQNKINHLDLLEQWQQANPNSFHFSLQFSEKHAYISCSPERLFRREKCNLKTEALAGTINRGRNEREDDFLLQNLLTDKKIDRENYLVQEFIISNLKTLKAQVKCDDAYVLQLQSVQHLCVPINATLNANTTDANLLYHLHPTPAVGGCPKQPALQFINDKEPYLRGWYAGTVGYLRHDTSDFSVAIRSALITGNKIKLFAGAGIVTGSIATQEWQELDNKIQTVLEIIENE
ncbi:MAG: isochorismate synthase [Psychromonas sp.]|nr:isochorismate synthase [Psychromonas sp.]